MEQLMLGDTGPTLTTIDILPITLDKRIQQRVAMDDATVAAYEALYREGHDLGLLTVFDDGETRYLVDGFHRLLAALAAGRATLPALVHQGTFRDALLYATSCNKHGKARTKNDKRKAVSTLLADEEWCRWSDNSIAKHVGVSQPFVSQLRKSLITVISEHGEDAPSQPTTRQYINKHGQQVTMEVDRIGHRNGQTICPDCDGPLTDADPIRHSVGPVCACTTPTTASGNASPDPLPQDVSTSEPATLDPAQQIQTDAEQAHHAAEACAQRQARACAEAVEHLDCLAGEYGVEVVETQILAVFLAAHGKAAPASHVSQAVDLGAIPEEVPHTIPTAPRQAPQTGLAARVRAALPTYGLQGTTAGALAKVLGVSHDKTWRNLERLVKQGKARKAGTTYIFLAEKKQE